MTEGTSSQDSFLSMQPQNIFDNVGDVMTSSICPLRKFHNPLLLILQEGDYAVIPDSCNIFHYFNIVSGHLSIQGKLLYFVDHVFKIAREHFPLFYTEDDNFQDSKCDGEKKIS